MPHQQVLNTHNYKVSSIRGEQVGRTVQHSHLSLVVPNDGATVRLDHVREIVCSERPAADPARQLVVPHAVVAAEELAVGLGEVRDLVTARERERAPRRLSRVLHAEYVRQHCCAPLAIDVGVRRTMTLTHFMLFPGVICPNSLLWLSFATYAVSVSSGLSVALPK